MLPGGRPDPAHRTVQRVGVEQESADVAVPGVPVEREDAVAGGDDVRERLVPHLPDDELPLILPELEDYKGRNGQAPLENATEWKKYDRTGIHGDRETSTMPGSAGSSWQTLYWI